MGGGRFFCPLSLGHHRGMADDATMQLIRDLGDDSKYVTLRRVAVFRAHTRTFKNPKTGKTERYSVTDRDLPEIASNTNQAYQSAGQPVRLHIGHTNTEPDFPELAQPVLYGFAVNYKAELVQRPAGKVLVVTQEERILREMLPTVRRYPFRSVEYDPARKAITGCAAIIRTPFLQTGAVMPYQGTSKTYTYQMELPVEPNTTEMDPNTTEMDPNEDMEYSKFAKFMKRYQMESATNQPPVEEEDDEEKKKAAMPPQVNNQAGGTEVQYAALTRQIEELKASQLAAQRQLVTERIDRQLAEIAGVVKFDRSREVGYMATLPDDAARISHVQYMLSHYEKYPVGGMIQTVVPGANSPGNRFKSDHTIDPTVAPPNHEKVMAYIRANPGVNYEAAVSKILHG